jgi:hypothetical protein
MNSNENKSETANRPASNLTRDLWPDVMPKTKLCTPLTVLKEQAALLGPKTQNIVTARVTSGRSETGDLVSFFHLVAPALDGYKVAVFAVKQGITALYPVEINSTIINRSGQTVGVWKIRSEEELLSTLKEIFAHPKMIQAIQSLIAQSEITAVPEDAA